MIQKKENYYKRKLKFYKFLRNENNYFIKNITHPYYNSIIFENSSIDTVPLLSVSKALNSSLISSSD